MKPVAIFLCDKTGHMAEPWEQAGYESILVDPQHPKGVWSGAVRTKVGATILDCMSYLGKVIRTRQVAFVFGFPPCTDVAVSGSRWFEDKAKLDKHFQAKAALVAEQCRTVGMLSGAPWGFENPVSVFSSIFGKPNHSFDPMDYTLHCADDNYYKKTCVWSGNGFKMPMIARDYTLGAPDERIHTAAPGPERANFRSATPRGFAIATFLANQLHKP